MPLYDLTITTTYETKHEAETAENYVQTILEYPGSQPTFFAPVAWSTVVERAVGFDGEPLEDE